MYDTEPESADPGHRWDTPERIDPPQCERCGRTEVRITVAGLGTFCSLACVLDAQTDRSTRKAG